MKQNFNVFFDLNGHQLTGTGYPSWRQITSKENYIFEDTLFYAGYTPTRSTIAVIWEDRNGKQYRSSMEMLNKILSGNDYLDNKRFLPNFQITGKFTFYKKGTSIFLTITEML